MVFTGYISQPDVAGVRRVAAFTKQCGKGQQSKLSNPVGGCAPAGLLLGCNWAVSRAAVYCWLSTLTTVCLVSAARTADDDLHPSVPRLCLSNLLDGLLTHVVHLLALYQLKESSCFPNISISSFGPLACWLLSHGSIWVDNGLYVRSCCVG